MDEDQPGTDATPSTSASSPARRSVAAIIIVDVAVQDEIRRSGARVWHSSTLDHRFPLVLGHVAVGEKLLEAPCHCCTRFL